MLAPDGEQRARDGEFIGGIQEMQLPKTPGEVQRRGQPAGAQCRDPAPGLDEVKLLVEFDPVGHAQPAVKVHQVDAASQQHMLAIVDHFRLAGLAGKRVGSSASAQKPAGLEQIHLESGLPERRRGRQSGQTAADHDGCGHQKRMRAAAKG